MIGAVDVVVPFLGGLAGSLHCIGMCGGFPLMLAAGAASRGARPGPAATGNALRQILYNAGRLNTLLFLGAVSGAAGGAVVALAPARRLESWLAIAAGTLMVAIGLEMLGILARFTARGAAFVQATLGRWLSGVIASPSPWAPVALGVFNAFLPCHLIYAFAARAAATASPPRGALTMLAFGVGTIPAMLALGMTRSLFGPAVRLRLTRASGLLVVAFGALTLARGLVDLGGWHGLAHGPEHALQAAPEHRAHAP